MRQSERDVKDAKGAKTNKPRNVLGASEKSTEIALWWVVCILAYPKNSSISSFLPKVARGNFRHLAITQADLVRQFQMFKTFGDPLTCDERKAPSVHPRIVSWPKLMSRGQEAKRCPHCPGHKAQTETVEPMTLRDIA